MAFGDAYAGKRVLVTGHTGFKGAWLCEWLLRLGAEVTGFALPPPTKPSLFEQFGLAGRLRHIEGDVRDLDALRSIVRDSRPDFIFHLAAQSLVRCSYDRPAETYAVNVMGTVNLLESARLADRACSVVVITTDKCYENRGVAHDYREDEPLGGRDPYSSSKAAAELVVSAYRHSYFSPLNAAVRLASARAGNVVGGGDWAVDRIVPDCIRSLQRGEPIPVRNPKAVRPWQHVLEPLSGYLWLGARLAQVAGPAAADLCSAFNFGPAANASRTVGDLVQEVLKHWPGSWEDRSDPRAVHEARFLHLATAKAMQHLKWRSIWAFEQTVGRTIEGYRAFESGNAERNSAFAGEQIASYAQESRAQNLAWSR